ncbi:NAD(P)-dependent oxidoreductase [Dactylosporangium sp. CA-233914]|uniref:NAD(P)-dependent oxidoreductase n=1 Tax=Dactylosporangium sp. CA-233914 TaxID=3239934 RepID=UPI003D8CEEE3
MTTVAFIGIGTMGFPMATNMLAAGFAVRGYSRTGATRERFAKSGGLAAASVREAVQGADIVCLMLPDSPDVEQVMTVPDGVLGAAAPGTLVVDFSTVTPACSMSMAEASQTAGCRYIDAPVSGGEAGAIDGTLSVMVGGDEADVERARPVIEAVSAAMRRVGGVGSGQAVKAANQLLVAGQLVLVAEALQLLRSFPLDIDAALDVLRKGLAGSTVLDRKAMSMLAGDTRPGFRSELHHKDLGIVAGLARENGVATPVTAVVAQLMSALVATGRGALDHSAVSLLIGELSRPNHVSLREEQ